MINEMLKKLSEIVDIKADDKIDLMDLCQILESALPSEKALEQRVSELEAKVPNISFEWVKKTDAEIDEIFERIEALEKLPNIMDLRGIGKPTPEATPCEHRQDTGTGTVEYQSGVPHGRFRTYYPNGLLERVGRYVNGKLDGVLLEYYESGKPRQKAFYRAGKLHGMVITYYPQGYLKSETPYINGWKEGVGLKVCNRPPIQVPAPQPEQALTFDARTWAKAFNETLVKLGYQPHDEGWLISWFANAIMKGYDEHASRQSDKGKVAIDRKVAEEFLKGLGGQVYGGQVGYTFTNLVDALRSALEVKNG